MRERYPGAHFPAVQGHVENDALAAGGVGGQVAHRVEQRIPGKRLGTQCAQAARLGQPTGFGRAVARLAQMVVAGGGEPHLVTVVQVHPSEPLERAVLGHDLDQGLQQRVVQPVVAGLVGVGYHHHVFGIVVGTQTLVEQRQGAELLGRDAATFIGSPEQHVVMPALGVPNRPFVAEKSNERALLRVAPYVVGEHVPFEVVHPRCRARSG